MKNQQDTMGFLLNRWMVNLNHRKKLRFWVRVILVEASSFSTVWLSFILGCPTTQ